MFMGQGICSHWEAGEEGTSKEALGEGSRGTRTERERLWERSPRARGALQGG